MAGKVLVVTNEPADLGPMESALASHGVDVQDMMWSDSQQAEQLMVESEPEVVLVLLGPEQDPPWRQLERMRRLTPGRLLAVGPIEDSRRVLRVLRLGVDDYLDESRFAEELGEALSRPLPSRTAFARIGKVVAVLGSSGGCGASTVAVNLGTALASAAKKALLVDMKLETGDLAALLDLLPGHTLADLSHHADRLDHELLEEAVSRHECGIALLASPRQNASILDRVGGSMVAGPRLHPEGIHKILVLAQGVFPWTVLDVNPNFREEQVEALRLADRVLVVLRLDFLSLKNTRRTLDHLSWLGIDEKAIRLVANRTGQPREVPQAKAEEALGLRIHHALPEDVPAVNRAVNHGIPALLCEPRSRYARAIQELTHAVLQELPPDPNRN